VLLITDAAGRIYLRQRPATGLLASLWELPHTGWESTPLPPLPLSRAHPRGRITHSFTHFKLTLDVAHATTPQLPAANAFTAGNLPPLSTLMKKALAEGLKSSQGV
jgi:A/G-specific adenine glycosylase